MRTLGLSGADVAATRAEASTARASLVALRAVEQFERILPVAAGLLTPPPATPPAAASSALRYQLQRPPAAVSPQPRLALMIGAAQADAVRRLLPAFRWRLPVTSRVPISASGGRRAGVRAVLPKKCCNLPQIGVPYPSGRAGARLHNN